ncbi:hypothetical protein [Paracidovorax valerianellae]|uniref:Uncharacterized protein n=1 Tax=Paracidovorax valerianellae TaxID=187868 RepID=A0A1G7FFS1_9BURK|nr:hypothetical protein [Paracidovorax valerianellae]MDA8443912.1 hypothetical protein [Paracidovorax valerianellae]SDE74727.1 hypothetical protein SAMN05192589_12918 [Paracidovorax valerianellae]
MKEAVDVVVLAEDPSDVSEGKTVSTGLSPSDHLTDIKQQYELAEIAAGLKAIEARLTRDEDLHALRKRYSLALFWLVVVWVVTVWVFLILQGIGKTARYPNWAFKLSDTVLIAYITSTTASILGLFGIAAYWLFGKPKAADTQGSKPAKPQKGKKADMGKVKSKPPAD